MRRQLWLVLTTILMASGQSAQAAEPNDVIVMGMIHSGHRQAGPFDLAHLQDIIRRVKPDVVLTEIPPDRLETANRQFAETGRITESRVRVFPEYTDALYPLTREMDFTIVACAAWTTQMNDSRRATMARLKTTHAAQYREMELAQRNVSTQVENTIGDYRDPRVIHTDAYDALVKAGMEPYDRYFNDAIGDGGWSNINAAHYANIATALDSYTEQGKRVLITFGSWHKYYIKEQLRKRDDIRLVSLAEFLPQPSTASDTDTAKPKSATTLLADFAAAWDEANWEKNFRGVLYMRNSKAQDWQHRMTALRSLVLLGEEAVPALTAALDSPHSPTRVLAAQALSYLGPDVDISRLMRTAQTDTTAAARLYAVDAIGGSGKSPQVDWEQLLSTERNRDVRKHINYAQLRADQPVSADVMTALRQWDPATMDTARVGAAAPDFRLKTIEGQPVALSDFRGQPIVLVFIYGDT